MNKIILHRGNTFKGIENSLEAIDPDTLDLEQYVDFKKIDGIGIGTIFEVDIVTKSPFIVHHTTEDKVDSVFDILDVILFPERQYIKDKYVWELTEDEIKWCVHKNTLSKPMILRELLELAKQKNIKLYLDIKVPEYADSDVWNHMLLFREIFNMCEMINEYVQYGIIDCVLSFSVVASMMIRFYSFLRGYKFDRGMFCWQHVETDFFKKVWMDKTRLNRLYMHLLYFIISPIIISYEAELIEVDTWYLNLSLDMKRYVWTYHKSMLINKSDFLIRYGLVPVVDTFDLKK